MNVAIVDFSHQQVAEAFLRVLQSCSDRVSVVTNERIRHDLQRLPEWRSDNVEFTIVDGGGEDQLRAVREVLASGDIGVCVFSTIDEHFEAYRDVFRSFAGKKLLVLHNINFWLQRARRFRIFPVPRSPYHEAMLEMVATADALIVLSDQLRQFIERKYGLSEQVVTFTIAITDDAGSPFHENGQLRIVVPGQIEEKRRDYDALLDAVAALDPRQVRLTLLGKPFGEYGSRIAGRCMSLRETGFSVKWYDSYITQEEFEREMAACSVIVAPIVRRTIFWRVTEIYGESKIAGALPDMIRYSRPGIIPRDFPVPESMRSSVMTYGSTSELTTLLNEMTSAARRSELAANAAANSRGWDAASVRERFRRDLAALGISVGRG